MKILWFTNTSSLAATGEGLNSQGGGWISSLEELILTDENVHLGICFYTKESLKIVEKNRTYYGIKNRTSNSSFLYKIYSNWKAKNPRENQIDDYIQIVKDFSPDLIHVFGTERAFGLIQDLVDVPVVIHLQGLLGPIANSYFPPGIGSNNFYWSWRFLLNNALGNSPAFAKKMMRWRANRENAILATARYVMGRTDWDKQLALWHNPAVKYFKVNEVLRPDFYSLGRIESKIAREEFQIVSVMSASNYKGMDVIFKVSRLLEDKISYKVKWLIVGLDETSQLYRFYRDKYRFDSSLVSINCLGVIGKEDLQDVLISSDLYVHPSYIDNSPNSICEAQISGVPVIASNVGGIGSLIVNEQSGILVPANDIYLFAANILNLLNDKPRRLMLAANSKEIAKERHDRETVLRSLLDAYRFILNNSE